MLPEWKCLVGRDTPSHCLSQVLHPVTRNSIVGPFPEGLEVIALGMGCFWCSEGHFVGIAKTALSGIYSTSVGYSQGITKNPTYDEVCSGQTNHCEVVRILYDPKIRPFKSILKDFWELHDPTTLYRQGNDVGTQYRSGIYYTTTDQRDLAQETRDIYQAALSERGISGKIITEIEPMKNFYLAEEYHQQYDLKPGSRAYCGLRPTGVSLPECSRKE